MASPDESLGCNNLFRSRSDVHYLIAICIIVPPLLLFVNSVGDVKYSLKRFLGYSAVNGALATVTDFDRDGYSYFTFVADSHPFDRTRNLLALDRPGNGIDENDLAGDFSYLESTPVAAPIKFGDKKKHLILIVLESVRGDAFGKMINGQELAPNLNALALQGSYAESAYSPI